jgi:hypothetical protein
LISSNEGCDAREKIRQIQMMEKNNCDTLILAGTKNVPDAVAVARKLCN